jgi:hypothetical protein
MRAFLIGLLGLWVIGYAGPVQAADSDKSCSVALNELGQQWDAMGFTAPQKPSQAYVTGRGGRTISGVKYQRITNAMRFAAQDCAAGREEDAHHRIQSIQAMFSSGRNG